ncbi:oxygenase MpaB family protein [Phenylobacterium sp. J426]|uniref:oxygenase MpaB family protein n=1 Tax=Phenylobacterium sp. J426 TaxID=2898439 RepID=UPI002151E444|nr:oxygenase MpaB family protein [Phenylobacterium sp. J426]MCR5872930.1 oxygenase MpaB family protein [Phenylobacterium sp. J426]
MTEIASYMGWKVDFASPKGAAAYLEPDSISWRVFKNPIALGVGGVAAVLLEFAEPRIRSGVWDHSTYKADPIGRSRRTGMAAMVGVYGPQAAARRVIQGVTNMHAQVSGETPGGRAYRALDPELLDWVHATAGFGFVNAYHRFVAPLTPAEFDAFYREGEPIARLYGVQTPLTSSAHFIAMMESLAPGFEPHPIVGEFLDIICSGKAAPGVPKLFHRALAKASVSLLPQEVRQVLQLGPEWDLRATDRVALKLAGRLAERVVDPSSPPCQASARLGLPRDLLYRSRAEQQRLVAAWRARQAPTEAMAAE